MKAPDLLGVMHPEPSIAYDAKADRERRLANQRAFPHSFIACPCKEGCITCAWTGRITKAGARQMEAA